MKNTVHLSRLRFEEAGHIFDSKNVNTFLDELTDEVKVILECIFGLFGAGNVTTVANDGFDNTTSLFGGVDTEFHLKNPKY